MDSVTEYAQYRFPTEFNATKHFIRKELSILLDLSIKQINDISAILVLYTNSMHTIYWKTSKHIAFSFEGNRYITENIRAHVTWYLGKHHCLYFPDSADLSAKYFVDNEIELLVTNYDEYLLDLDIDVPVLLFDRIPSNKDWKRLLDILEPSDSFSL